MDYPDRFVQRVLITVAIVGALYVVWQVREVFMLIFGALVVATAMRVIADGIMKILPLSEKTAVGFAVFSILSIFAVALWLIGDLLGTQMGELLDKLPHAISATNNWLNGTAFGRRVLDLWRSTPATGVPWSQVADITSIAVGGLGYAFLIVAIGLYLAAAPGPYRRGFISLVPPSKRAPTESALVLAADGLRHWLIGQILCMLVVGMLTTVALSLIKMPLALSLGIIAGLTAFIPFLGPIFFGFLTILLAFAEGPEKALQVAFVCLGIQQLEGYVITPIIQRRAVSLPPALGLISVIFFGLLFGMLGILFATPLMVVIMILVQKLYVEYGLENSTIYVEK